MTLKEAFAEFDKAITRAEEYIRSLGCVVCVSVPIGTLEPHLTEYQQLKLGWDKEGVFKLCFIDKETGDRTAWNNVPLRVRIVASNSIPLLIKEVRKQSDTTIEDLRIATETLNAVIDDNQYSFPGDETNAQKESNPAVRKSTSR